MSGFSTNRLCNLPTKGKANPYSERRHACLHVVHCSFNTTSGNQICSQKCHSRHVSESWNGSPNTTILHIMESTLWVEVLGTYELQLQIYHWHSSSNQKFSQKEFFNSVIQSLHHQQTTPIWLKLTGVWNKSYINSLCIHVCSMLVCCCEGSFYMVQLKYSTKGFQEVWQPTAW